MIVLNPPCPTCRKSLATTVKVIDRRTKAVACVGCGSIAIVQEYDNQEIANLPSPEMHKRRKPILPPPWLRKDTVKQKGLKDE